VCCGDVFRLTEVLMIDEMAEWFGHGEQDVGAMIRFGMLTETQLVRICLTLTDSPWYRWAL